MNKIYDLIILGAGPAGITAAVYAVRKKLDIQVFSLDVGGQAAWSGDVENYTGYQFISGPDLTLKFREHINSAGVPLHLGKAVQTVTRSGDLIEVLAADEKYFSRSVVIATGKRPRMLEVEGEKEYHNKGVTYCATCDGPLFRDKRVAVVGGGNSALDAVLQLKNIASYVYLINQDSELIADPIMIEKARKAGNVEIWNLSRILRIRGDSFVRRVAVEKEGLKQVLEVEGIFIEIGLIPNSGCAEIVKRNQKQEIIVDKYNRTSVEGVFAAGDVTDVPEKQIIIACGEGAKASLSAFHYLARHRW